MVFKYKLPGMYPVPAQETGEELERIYRERGKCDAKDVVDESRPEDAALHPCFEWQDDVAAELYREHQARKLINCVVTVAEKKHGGTMEVRAFQFVQDTYTPLNVVLQSTDMRAEMIDCALREFQTFKRKLEAYKEIDAVAPVIREIDRAIKHIKSDRGEETCC